MSKHLCLFLLLSLFSAGLVACASSAKQPAPATATSASNSQSNAPSDPYMAIEDEIYNTNYKQAIAMADALVNSEGPNVHNLTLRGIAYAKYNKPYPALMDLIEASKIDRNVDTLINVGNALRMFGHCDRATDAYRQALTISPDNPEILMDLTSAYLCLADLDMANETIQKSFANFPKDAIAYTNVAILKHQTQEFSESRLAAEKAIELDPNYRPAYEVLQLACIGLQDNECINAAKDKANSLKGFNLRNKRVRKQR